MKGSSILLLALVQNRRIDIIGWRQRGITIYQVLNNSRDLVWDEMMKWHVVQAFTFRSVLLRADLTSGSQLALFYDLKSLNVDTFLPFFTFHVQALCELSLSPQQIYFIWCKLSPTSAPHVSTEDKSIYHLSLFPSLLSSPCYTSRLQHFSIMTRISPSVNN